MAGVLKNAWPFIVAALVLIVVVFSSGESHVIEFYYSKALYPLIASLFSSVSSLIPFSIWDLFWLSVIVILVIGFALALFRKLKLRWFLLRLCQFSALIYAFFYLAWGFNYFRPNLESRIGWESPKGDEAVFRSILDSILIHANSSRVAIQNKDYETIDRLIEESYQKNRATLGIHYPNGSRRPKTMLFSSFFAKSGVSGYFGPFFNEVHLNYYLLPMEYPFVLAHEKAHQFGITNEAEANLAAFMVCTTSPDRRLQYSGYVNLLPYFISDASEMPNLKDYIKKIDAPVLLDLRFQRSHWNGLRNKTLDQVQTAANNAYLKTNRIEEGVKNYNQVVGLVISWYNNEKLVIPSNTRTIEFSGK